MMDWPAGRVASGTGSPEEVVVAMDGSLECRHVDGPRRVVRASIQTVLAAIMIVVAMASAAHAANRAMSWGLNRYGLLGDGIATYNEPHGLNGEIPPAYTVPEPVCAVGTAGECSLGPYLNEVSEVEAGNTHSLALLSNGTVMAWGENDLGQLGDGTFSGPATCAYLRGVHHETEETAPCAPSPVAVSGLTGATAVAVGNGHSLALLSDGTVMAWGDNSNGQLGDGSTESSDVPVPVSGLGGVVAIAAGGHHSMALLSDGTVMAWGQNQYGQLGDGSTEDRHAPIAVGGLSEAIAISAGEWHSMALLSDGTAMAWGGNGNGQLGDGTYENTDVPVAVSGLSGITTISAGGQLSLAQLGDGTVRSWGLNSNGTLGIGGNGAPPANSDVPVEVCAVGVNPEPVCTTGPYLTGVTAVSAGIDHDMALLKTGAVVSWGAGYYGQLGIDLSGMSAWTSIPKEAIGLSDVHGISSGGSISLAFGPVAPSVASVSPNQGLEAGGTSVTISGINFGQASAVDFGATAAAKFTVNSSTSVTAISPPGTGTVDVTVTTPEGTSSIVPADRFKYTAVPPPTVTKLKPTSGPAGAGTVVTISGSSFSEVSSVKFGATEAASYTVNSPTSITAVTPPEPPGTVNVTVTTPVGTSAISTKDRFKFTPTISGLSPNAGPKAGGTTVTVTGTGFALGTKATTFQFGSAKGTGANCTSSTTCTVVSPAHEGATVDVVATVNKVKSPKTTADKYTYS